MGICKIYRAKGNSSHGVIKDREMTLFLPDWIGSDHRPLLMTLYSDATVNLVRYPKRFTFEHKWFLEEGFDTFFKNCWQSIIKSDPLPDKLLRCRGELQNWAGTHFNQLGKKIQKLRKEVNLLMSSTIAKFNTGRISEIEKEIEKLSYQEEIHWKQRSRVNWLNYGDRNTKYFHSSATTRRNTNQIRGLNNADGVWCTDYSSLVDITTDYFTCLFTSIKPSTQDIAMVMDTIVPVVGNEMNDKLCEPFTEDEIRKAVFDLSPSKAPGSDGFTAMFYQKLWTTVGRDVTKAVLEILNEKGDLKEWNSTVVTLIPKVSEPKTLKDYRPISLCNTCYKIVSRAITNRFRPILAQLIDSTQSAFLPGRLILDNVLVGFECMNWIRNNLKAKSGFAALKLDMSKAYDRVEWIYLQKLLLKMGFAEGWVELLMKCVTTVSYSFKINHSIFGTIKPTRGIRQGDPLSPYLFVLCTQGLSSLIRKSVECKLFKGVKVASTSPVISHLFFADDSLVFFRTKRADCLQVRNCLQMYSRASGQLVNYDKSAITFSPSTSAQSIEDIKDVLAMEEVKGLKARYFKYCDILEADLGSNPSYVWRSLLWGCDIIKRGLCWRVGDGQHIFIKSDPWIPGLPSFKCNPSVRVDPSMRVARLISSSGHWQAELVRQIFTSHEAEAILNIPLNNKGCQDIRYWKDSPNGLYTVRLGYLLEMNISKPPPFQSSHPLKQWWKLIWSLHIPPKVRIFMWRASHDIIPTSGNLRAHHVPTADCGLVLSKELLKEDFELFVMMSWAIWYEVCKINNSITRLQKELRIDWAVALLDVYRRSSTLDRYSQLDGSLATDHVWHPPLPNQLRLDVDAGCCQLRNKFSVGVVLRNSVGGVVGAKACLIRPSSSVKGAELMAIQEGMDFCRRHSLKNVCIFSDSIQAIQAVTKPGEDRGPDWWIITEIRSCLESSDFISLRHARRASNKAAHHLATEAIKNDAIGEWFNCLFSSSFMNIVLTDSLEMI
ncbi:uncharacterized protein [Primulina huaijiensis]|uniref:uncharacterized protein n=1 Tax=Primulina huaijiensis TaxID=1492673 RepID=UPI003CC76F9F